MLSLNLLERNFILVLHGSKILSAKIELPLTRAYVLGFWNVWLSIAAHWLKPRNVSFYFYCFRQISSWARLRPIPGVLAVKFGSHFELRTFRLATPLLVA